MTDDEMAALERAAKAAAPGKWRSIPAPFLESAHQIEVELPCINGLSAWFTIAVLHDPSDAELGYTEGAIGSAKERSDYIAAAHPAAVLALIERVRKAEEARTVAIREMADMARQAGSWQGIAEGKGAIIRDLERARDAARAQAIREAAAVCDKHGKDLRVSNYHAAEGAFLCRDDILALLPEDQR